MFYSVFMTLRYASVAIMNTLTRKLYTYVFFFAYRNVGMIVNLDTLDV